MLVQVLAQELVWALGRAWARAQVPVLAQVQVRGLESVYDSGCARSRSRRRARPRKTRHKLAWRTPSSPPSSPTGQFPQRSFSGSRVDLLGSFDSYEGAGYLDGFALVITILVAPLVQSPLLSSSVAVLQLQHQTWVPPHPQKSSASNCLMWIRFGPQSHNSQSVILNHSLFAS